MSLPFLKDHVNINVNQDKSLQVNVNIAFNLSPLYKNQESEVLFAVSPLFTKKSEDVDSTSVHPKQLPKDFSLKGLSDFQSYQETSAEDKKINGKDYEIHSDCSLLKSKPNSTYLTKKKVNDETMESGSYITFIGDALSKHLA